MALPRQGQDSACGFILILEAALAWYGQQYKILVVKVFIRA